MATPEEIKESLAALVEHGLAEVYELPNGDLGYDITDLGISFLMREKNQLN